MPRGAGSGRCAQAQSASSLTISKSLSHQDTLLVGSTVTCFHESVSPSVPPLHFIEISSLFRAHSGARAASPFPAWIPTSATTGADFCPLFPAHSHYFQGAFPGTNDDVRRQKKGNIRPPGARLIPSSERETKYLGAVNKYRVNFGKKDSLIS